MGKEGQLISGLINCKATKLAKNIERRVALFQYSF